MTNTSRPLEGIRIVELAVFIAAPTCTKALTDLGAEVIKVESKEGDSLRKLAIEAQPGRPWSAFFDVINMNKRFVSIDAKKEAEEGGLSLHGLLAQADVLVTNIRPAGLERMGLSYGSICKRHPHLIYAHLTAWGLGGPDSDLPGYDIGAFWAMTGMAAQTSIAPHYHSVPVGFGDTATGICLAGAIINALIKKLRTGRGMQLETSLFGTGLWAAAGGLLNGSGRRKWEIQSDDKIPTYPEGTGVGPDPFNTIVETVDRYKVAVSLNGQGDERDAEIQDSLRELTGKGGVDGAAALRSMVKKDKVKQVEAKLRSLRIPHQLITPFRSAADAMMVENKGWAAPLYQANVLTDAEGVYKDLRYFVRTPYDIDGYGCGSNIRSPARPIGYDDVDVKTKGWTLAKLPFPPPGEHTPGQPLQGLTVVELGDPWEHSAALGTRMLADAGAKVVRVGVEKQEARLREGSPEYYSHLVGGKEVVLADDMASAIATVKRLVSDGASALVTNLPEELLKTSGIAELPDSNPRLVYVYVTPWGRGKAGPRGELLSFWAAAGVPNYMAGAPDPPSYFGAALAGLHISCLCTAMLFRVQLTGKGGVGHTSLLGCGAWCVLSMVCIGQLNPLNHLFQRDKTGYLRRNISANPAFTVTVPKTKDGQLIQLLGVEWPRHFVRTYDSINATRSTQIKAIATLLGFTVPAGLLMKLTGRDWKTALFPIFRVLNTTLFEGFKQRDWEDIKKEMDKNDVWYCRVRAPGQVFDSQQARVTGRLFDCSETGHVRIAAPPIYTDLVNSTSPKL
eukprot:Hpha_TRINITY_DN16354_c5_g4::TRINITY_DN16354_c5_g4_i1::g.60385::m.60385